MDLSHLDALLERRRRLQAAAVSEFTQVQLNQCEKEIRDEYKFLGIPEPESIDISDADLLAALLET